MTTRKNEAIEYVRQTYSVPAKIGGRVIYSHATPARHGTITGARNGRLLIRMDGDKNPRPYHPTWMLDYE
jgi:hypothetical protein